MREVTESDEMSDKKSNPKGVFYHVIRVIIMGILFMATAFCVMMAAVIVLESPGMRKYNRLCAYPNKDALFAAEPDEVKKVIDFSQNGTNYTAVVLSWIGFLPSGPAVFIYDEGGKMVDHCSDSGECDSFLRRWHYANW